MHIALIFTKKGSTPPGVMLPVISERDLVFRSFLHEFRYVGLGIFNRNYGSFHRVVSWYVHTVCTFVEYCSTFTPYVLFVLSCSSDRCLLLLVSGSG